MKVSNKDRFRHVYHLGAFEVSGLGLGAYSHGSFRLLVAFIRNLVNRLVLWLPSWLAPPSLSPSFFFTA